MAKLIFSHKLKTLGTITIRKKYEKHFAITIINRCYFT